MAGDRSDQPTIMDVLKDVKGEQQDMQRTPQMPVDIAVGFAQLVAGALTIGGPGDTAERQAHARLFTGPNPPAGVPKAGIMVFKQTAGAAGTLYLSAHEPGIRFTITSTTGGDTSWFMYVIFRKR